MREPAWKSYEMKLVISRKRLLTRKGNFIRHFDRRGIRQPGQAIKLNHEKIKRKSFSYRYTNLSRSLVLVVHLMDFSNTYWHACGSLAEWHSPLP